jgi:hypothetical protein
MVNGCTMGSTTFPCRWLRDSPLYLSRAVLVGLDAYQIERLYLCAQGKRPARVLAPNADVAQLAEQRFCKPWVAGSSPIVGSALTRPHKGRAMIIMGRYPSGQRGLTVNQLASPSGVRISLCPPYAGRRRSSTMERPSSSVVEHTLGKGEAVGSIPTWGSSDTVRYSR